MLSRVGHGTGLALYADMPFSRPSLAVLVFSVVSASSSWAADCRVKALSITSDMPGFPAIDMGLVVDRKTLKITQLEFSSPTDTKGKVARVSASLVAALSGALNDKGSAERLSIEIDKPMDHVEQIRAQFGQGQFDVDVNPDWLPAINDVLKISGRFDSTSGATMTIDAHRGFNPFDSRAKIHLALERKGPSCEDWRFHVVDGARSRPIAGIILKVNRIGNLPVGVDEIAPVDLDPSRIQHLIGMVTSPASLGNSAMVSTEKEKRPSGGGAPRSHPMAPVKSSQAI